MDSERDALVPAETVLTNTSKGFDAELALFLEENTAPFNPQQNINLEADEGTQCGSLSGSSNVIVSSGSADQVSPGQSEARMFYFVIPGYYSPDHPGGSPALINDYVLTAQGTSTTIRYILSGLSGPGIDAKEFLFTLTGASADAAVAAESQASINCQEQTPGNC